MQLSGHTQQVLHKVLASALDADEWLYIRSENVHARKTRRQAVLCGHLYWVILTGVDCNSLRQI